MKTITLTIPDNLYAELEGMKERDTDTVEKVAEDVLYDVVFEDDISEKWEEFNELDQLFERIPVLSEALQNFSDVIVICGDTGSLSKDESMNLLTRCNELLSNYHRHEIPENLELVVTYLQGIYEKYKEDMLIEAKRLAALPKE